MQEVFPPNVLCEVGGFEEIEGRALAATGIAHGEEESRMIVAAGLHVELRTNSPTVADEIEQSLYRAPKLRSPETCHVTIAHLRNPMSLLGTEFKSLGPECIPTSSPVVLFSCALGGIDVILNVVSRRLLLTTTRPDIDASTIGHHAVRILLSSLGRGVFTAVHSAAVWQDRELILLVGRSGAGKSTTKEVAEIRRLKVENMEPCKDCELLKYCTLCPAVFFIETGRIRPGHNSQVCHEATIAREVIEQESGIGSSEST